MAVEAVGFRSAALDDGGSGGVEAGFDKAGMVMVYLLGGVDEEANVEEAGVGGGGDTFLSCMRVRTKLSSPSRTANFPVPRCTGYAEVEAGLEEAGELGDTLGTARLM